MIIYHCQQRSSAWFDARCGRVTGTRFKDLMVYEHDYKKAIKSAGYQGLIAEIAAELITSQTETSYSNDIMQRGIDLEPEVRRLYEDMFDVVVDEVGFCTPNEDSPFFDWVGVSPDGLTDGLLEIKCPLAKTHFNYIEGNVLPSEYKWQVQGQLYVTELPYCDFMSYYPGMKPFIIRVLPDSGVFEQITERLHLLIPEIKNKIEIYNNYDNREN